MDAFTFYYTIGSDEWRPQWFSINAPIMLPASSWAGEEVKEYGRVRKSIAPVTRLPSTDTISKKAADSGGFVAMNKWGGEYRYTPSQYVEWLDGWLPDWSACMDFCCEDELTRGKPGIVRERQQKTTEMAYHIWETYRDRSYTWVPTIQGWKVNDYIVHAREMKKIIQEMQAFYDVRDGQEQSEFRVGIGTLCRRLNVKTIRAIALAVAQELPKVRCYHLWGVKKTLWKSPVVLPFKVSSDSASWNMKAYYAQREPEWKKWVEEQKAAGDQEASNRKHRYKVLMFETQAEIDEAMSQPKQHMMF
jgi:hypothetical protein